MNGVLISSRSIGYDGRSCSSGWIIGAKQSVCVYTVYDLTTERTDNLKRAVGWLAKERTVFFVIWANLSLPSRVAAGSARIRSRGRSDITKPALFEVIGRSVGIHLGMVMLIVQKGGVAFG